MTRDEVERVVRDIEAIAGDAEAAHEMQDALYARVLASIARGEHDAQGAALLAEAALQAQAIPFSRWYA